jgi:pimeloyl-ACP methyl ester carboxylesterase
VGHDWGAGFTFRVASTRPELVRSWAIDLGNGMHPDYEWHDFAKIWQTPDEGEKFFADQNAAPPEQRAQVFEMFGVPHDDAVALASHGDETMAGCILDLYRSAVPNIYADWGREADGLKSRPGLVLIAADDPFGDEKLARESAESVSARVEVLEGVGHWWPLQDAKAGAAALQKFWSSLG